MNRGLLVSLVVVLTSALGTDACTCMPEHPQVLYCRADFAIKAYIREKHDVYLSSDGSVEIIEKINHRRKSDSQEGVRESPDEVQPAPVIDGEASESLSPDETPEESPILGEPIIVNEVGPDRDATPVDAVLNGEVVEVQPPDLQEPEEASPGSGKEITGHVIQVSSKAGAASKINGGEEKLVHPPVQEAAAYRAIEYAYMGPQGAMPGYSEHFAGLSRDGPLGFRDHGPPSYSFAARKISGRHRRGVIFPGDTSPGAHRPSGVTGRGTKMTRYTVQVTRVLKGSVSNGTAYVFTPPNSPLCRMRLHLKTRYLLLGEIRDSRLHINHCDYKLDLGKLQHEEARHLVANMKYRFKRGCGNCTINVCRSRDCSAELARPKECLWRNIFTAMSPKASQFACIRLKNKKCGWFNALNKGMLPEDLDIVAEP